MRFFSGTNGEEQNWEGEEVFNDEQLLQNAPELAEEESEDIVNTETENEDDDKVTVSKSMLSSLQLNLEQALGEAADALDAAEEAKNDYLRVLAESKNFQRRQREETVRQVGVAKEAIILDLLPILDNFERALKVSAINKDFDSFYEGVNLILRQFQDMMDKNDVEIIESVGSDFDPEQHEAMMGVVNNELPINTVAEEFEKGYKLKDRVLRPAKVSVTKEG